jgi:hypothetical protein
MVVFDSTKTGARTSIATPAVFDVPIHQMDYLDPRALGFGALCHPFGNLHRVAVLTRPAIDEDDIRH